MRKIITIVSTAVLVTNLNANIIDEDLTLDDFRYAYSSSAGKCVAMTYALADKVHQDYKNKKGNFLQHGKMNIVGTNIGGKDMFILFYADKKDCQTLETDEESINTANAFAGLNIQIAKYCGVKASIDQTFEIAEYLSQNEKDDFKTLKEGLTTAGLICNN